ncbi:hypothetical protein BKA67DRAFT_555136 [Truncatella angustata]|uniref:Uncharacterized protein n=1 Tax=Truncatella angustata TaxID=152316 RepID=A0A9P8USE0_9PEZI|nr:uncharacterized protein BKA67DRAFT_555136 [Truncatella angustata]KAH6657383.1 hypothetical protein BKA67DRAFT_555136 [Truncatella angustata]
MFFITAIRGSKLSSLRPILRTISSTAPRAQCYRVQICKRLASTAAKASPKVAATAPSGAAPGTKYKYPERLQLFHAGVSRITFIACVKLSTILIFTFFTYVVTPKYYEKEGWTATTIRTALSGVIPLLFVGWTTSPFVLLVSMRLPPFARTSEQHLKRYLSKLPADTALEISTMSLIAKPRVSRVLLSELRPKNQRLGIVNYVRDTSTENAVRKWYHFRAVSRFSIQTNKTKGPLWFWESVQESIKRNQR